MTPAFGGCGLLVLLQNFWCVYVVPRVDRCQGLMISHVTLQWRYRNVASFDRVVVRADIGVGIKIFFADPKIGFAARVDVFSDDGPRILDTLPCDDDALDFSRREIDV